MANGRVCTGFSMPYVATYTNSGSTITYGTPTILARGVDVTIEPDDVGDDNDFWADNQKAETISGVFTGGTVTLNVDGLLTAAEKLIYGLPTAGTDGFTPYDDDMAVPYVGIGFVVRYMSAGVVTYVPVVLKKCKFNIAGLSAATQSGEEIDWQTQELTAKIMRDDGTKHAWKLVGEGQTTEQLAVNKIITAFGGTPPVTTGNGE